MTSDTQAAAPASEADRVSGTLRAFVEAVNRGDRKGALGRLAPDVTIIEDLPPYRWQGPGAGAEWMLAMWENGQRTGLTDVALELGAARRIEVERNHAYAVVPGRLSLGGHGGSLRADGLLTFSLRKSGEDWLIGAFAWTGPPPG